jgi:hypothetical protein
VEEGTLITVRYTVEDTEYECDCGALERQTPVLSPAHPALARLHDDGRVHCGACMRWHDAKRVVDPELVAKIGRLDAINARIAQYKAWSKLGRDLAAAETERRARWWKAWRSAWRSIGYFARINLEHGWRRTPDPSPHQP